MTEQPISLAAWEPEAGSRRCGSCLRLFPAWALYVAGDNVECGTCLPKPLESAASSIEQGWESERGKLLKVQRDRALNDWRWTIMPDSPLSPACRNRFMDYLRGLHRMTADHTPETWNWPQTPAFEYEEIAS